MTTFSMTDEDIEESYKYLIKYIDDQITALQGTVSLYEVGKAHQRIQDGIFEFEIKRSMYR